MKDRLQQFLELKNISAARLADMLGIQRSAISHILGGRNKPGYDFINKFLLTFPYVNADWFITGRGEAIKNLDPLPQPAPKRPVETLFTQQEQEIRKPSTTEAYDDFPIDNAEEKAQNIVPQEVNTANNTNELNRGGKCYGNNPGGLAAEENINPSDIEQYNTRQHQRNSKVEKVIILFSDGTYQELK